VPFHLLLAMFFFFDFLRDGTQVEGARSPGAFRTPPPHSVPPGFNLWGVQLLASLPGIRVGSDDASPATPFHVNADVTFFDFRISSVPGSLSALRMR